jgi:nicotinate-nucleotide adenylyltransferase
VRRVGLFGGTFDPPHLGHLALAEWARDQLALDRVVFMPAGNPPHKLGLARSSAARRLAMTRLAVKGNRAFSVSTIEADREGPSFTVDTLLALRQQTKGARIYLLMGADSLDEFHTWHAPEQILKLATLAVAARPGAGRASRRGRACSPHSIVPLDNPGIELSSSAIRARAREGKSVRYLVPDPVAAYIARHRLYREDA